MTGVEMVDVQGQLEREIADRRLHRRDVALTYAFAIRQQDEGDFGKVNRLIIERSRSGLEWIKAEAWRRMVQP